MRIYSSYQSFRAVAHPNIHNVRANVLHASRCKDMAQVILCNFFILHYSLENAIQSIQRTVMLIVKCIAFTRPPKSIPQ